jgi:hypothetical protein
MRMRIKDRVVVNGIMEGVGLEECNPRQDTDAVQPDRDAIFDSFQDHGKHLGVLVVERVMTRQPLACIPLCHPRVSALVCLHRAHHPP